MRLTLIILCLLFISACTQEINDRLQGHWVCVENCDEIKTLDFYKDSVEINRYLKFLRIKEKSFYKFNSEKDSLYCENTFYNEKRREIFYFALEGNILIFGEKESVFIRKNDSRIEEAKKFLSLDKINLHVPAVDEFRHTDPKYLNHVPELLYFKYQNGEPCLYENGSFFPVNKLKLIINDRLANLSEEGIAIRDFYLCIECKMKMKDVDSIFNTFREEEYFRLKLLYTDSENKNGIPEKYLTYYLSQFQNSIEYINYQFSLYKDLKIKNPLLKQYLSDFNENSTLKIQLKKGQIFLNEKLCRNPKEAFKKYKAFYSFDNNPTAFIKIDSIFMKEYDNFFSGNIPDKLELLIDIHQREIETKRAILKIIPVFYTLKYWQYSIIEIDPSTTYQEWMEMYLNLVSIHDKIRSEICNEFFQRDYYKLNKNILEDQEIIKMVRNILPFRLIPYIISPQ